MLADFIGRELEVGDVIAQRADSTNKSLALSVVIALSPISIRYCEIAYRPQQGYSRSLYGEPVRSTTSKHVTLIYKFNQISDSQLKQTILELLKLDEEGNLT